MANTAVRLSVQRAKRRNDPEIRAKIGNILDGCDEALEGAAELVKAASDVLSKYPIPEDAAYHCNIQDIQRISEVLDELVECRKKMDRERYISRLATGRLGAEIHHLGEEFTI